MKENEKELQQKYVELQILSNTANQMEQNLNLMESQIVELKRLNESLENLEKVKKDTESFVPIGGGILVKAQIKDTKKVLLNVGSKVLTEKKIPETKEYIDKQIKELERLLSHSNSELEKITSQIENLQNDMQELSK